MNGISGNNLPKFVSQHDQPLDELKQAINAIYDPRSTNEVRKNATLYLDEAKTHVDAASRGFSLASDLNQSPMVRHFGLSLLEYIIRYRWEDLDREAAESCRKMVIGLAQQLADGERPFIRNKIAQLWVEIAKKVWPEEWQDFDTQLLQLWQSSFAHQMMTLYMLELLSDDAFGKEEYGDGSKGGNIGKACTEIIIPSRVFLEYFPSRDQIPNIRAGDDGWVARLVDRLSWCCDNASAGQEAKTCALQVMSTLRSMVWWIFLKVISATGCIEALAKSLQFPDSEVQTAALDVLLTILNRPQYSDNDVIDIACPIVTESGLRLLHSIFQSSQVDVTQLDEQKYALRKKLAEVICASAGFIESHARIVSTKGDIASTVDLVEAVLRDSSLVVSIPALYLWTRLLNCSAPVVSEVVSRKHESLLETCTRRTLRYGNLSEDSQDETFLFLQVDFDTVPERHAFVGNYRRFCTEVIEKVVRTSPTEALNHFLNQTVALLNSVPNDKIVDEATYNSNSFDCLRVDAQCTVVASAVKSFCNWHSEQRSKGESNAATFSQVQLNIQDRCTDLHNRAFADPTIQRRVTQLVGDIVLSIFTEDSKYPIETFSGILQKVYTGVLQQNSHGDALKETNFAFARLLQKLAMRFANSYMMLFPDFESGIGALLAIDSLERRIKMDLRAVLFLIVHRCTSVGDEERIGRLRAMMRNVIEPWEDASFQSAAKSFESFCTLLGLENVPDYFLQGRAQSIEDWSTIKLDATGTEMRDSILSRLETMPLHVTKAFLTVATDRVRHGAREHQISVALWEDCIPIILPTLLPLLSHAHAFGNPQHWQRFPPEMQGIVQKILMDRVWQSGISSESRDEFYNKVRESRYTLEGLGSAIRAAVRGVRELSYWILHCFAQFGDALYKHQDLAEPLAQALYADAHVLSSHQVSTLLQISQAMIDGCPIHQRHRFLPPLIITLFSQVDRKLAIEWELMDRRQTSEQDEESLDQQMKAESILRQLSVAAVSLAYTLLQPTQQGTKSNNESQPLSKTAFGDPQVLSSVVIFCTHVLRIRDSRSCTRIIALFRELIPELGRKSPNGTVIIGQDIPSDTAAELREYFASEVLKNAISSFHEPYFTELQRDLAWLIAQIVTYCGNFTETPRQILMSLPNMSEQRIQDALVSLSVARKEREKRDVILKLLENLRGVSIHEIGKVTMPSSRNKNKTIQEQFMKVEDGPSQIRRGGSPEPGAMADLFG